MNKIKKQTLPNNPMVNGRFWNSEINITKKVLLMRFEGFWSNLIKTFVKNLSALCSKAPLVKRFYSLWATGWLSHSRTASVITRVSVFLTKFWAYSITLYSGNNYPLCQKCRHVICMLISARGRLTNLLIRLEILK